MAAAAANVDDRPNDFRGPLDSDCFTISSDIEQVQVATSDLDTAIVEGIKNASDHVKEDNGPLPSDRGPSISTNPDQASDATSIHSMPAAHISESQRPSLPTDGSPAPQPSSRPSTAATQNSVPQQENQSSALSHQQRRARHRSAIEVRTSNRLSGFFNNLIHRREPPASPVPDSITEDQNTTKPSVEKSSRPSSPIQASNVNPPPPPPPPLPPPTLWELGLSLSVVTSDLSPSHFSTPPVSGAFLAPHYLLLCHAQGLDVLPLTSPPAPQPYALVRRVAFKSVVVMEHRGVLVAIAGRRDGVRVYALEEVKKAIEWRIDVEVRRERERMRREAAKRIASRTENDLLLSGEKVRKTSLSTPPPSGNPKSILRKVSHGNIPCPPSSPPPPLVPRAARTPTRSRKSRLTSLQIPSPPSNPSEPPLDQPPPYVSSVDVQAWPTLRSQPSAVSVRARARSNSVSHVLAGVSAHPLNDNPPPLPLDNSAKSDDWAGSSDDEAIDIRASASGSQALDERTSATLSANRSPPSRAVVTQDTTRPRASTGSSRRQRPSNLDLSAAQNTSVVNPEPSPTPTLLTLRQALQHIPQNSTPGTFDDGDEDEDEADGRISLTQALMESRMPDLPPPGSVQPQEPILLSPTHPTSEEQTRPRSSDGDASLGRQNTTTQRGRRRRWSVMLTGSSSPGRNQTPGPASASIHDLPQTNHLSPGTSSSQANDHLSRSPSSRSNALPIPSVRPSASADPVSSSIPSSRASIAPSSVASKTSRSSRFFSRFINNALSRRSDERSPSTFSPIDADGSKWLSTIPPPPPAPPPKLEYVKLPGTKGALLIKAVETQKKSFLAILCGESGEKVELFAGTYRTALGLSRTFILPDSPRSLELQLQGDDLVEVFLVFAQNVFGLEPATVRVREVRIGRAERRAARRRARENRTEEPTAPENEANEDDGISLGVSVTVGSTAATGDGLTRPSTPPLVANEHPDAPEASHPGNSESSPSTSAIQSEELLPVSNAQMGSYTTFQQLSFAPKFPLASIADEYIIPPTYPDFLEYRDEYEQEGDTANKQLEVIPTQFSPPGLPIPAPSGPTQWYYKDPKGVMHGPWNSSLMQAWYRDGLLPADLPVRREGEAEYTLLKDLKLQCIDPAHPFRSPPLPSSTNITDTPVSSPHGSEKPLLSPISLLVQPKHFGPPALFFSSRGGHSTTIVDARGRSILKGRFIWTTDEPQDESKPVIGKMGDVRHLEALDIKDRSVLIAMRQGGLEAVDFKDALLRPADQSRTILPSFQPPSNTINRRPPFTWKIGTPINSSDAALSSLTFKGKSGLTSLPKKTGMGISKSTGSQASAGNDPEGDSNDEVLFLGRKEDEIYYCERIAGSFRVLRICPHTN